ALKAPVDLARTWIHGDLHRFNVLSSGGDFAGIIDWADLCQGDPAVDLGFLYTLLPPKGVVAAFRAYGERRLSTLDAGVGTISAGISTRATGTLSQPTATRARGIALDKATNMAVSDRPE